MSFVDGHVGHYEEDLARDCGDFIIRRSDGVYAYQLAVAADDGAMEISQVVRGMDLLDSTPGSCCSTVCWVCARRSFSMFRSCWRKMGRRLSKRDQDMDMGALRARYRPEEILGKLACLAGLLEQYEPVSARELVGAFFWDKIPKTDIIVRMKMF